MSTFEEFTRQGARAGRFANIIGGLTDHFYTFIGYNMDPERLETTLAEDLADAIAGEQPDGVIAAPA